MDTILRGRSTGPRTVAAERARATPRNVLGMIPLSAIVVCLMALCTCAQSASDSVVPGFGTRTLELGALRADVERSHGLPDVSGVSAGGTEAYATYFSKGLIVNYRDGIATTIRFIGDAALYSETSKFRSFPGKPDRGVDWGSPAAIVIGGYGEPLKREAFPEFKTNIPLVNLIYSDAAFRLKNDRLYQIDLWKPSPQPKPAAAASPGPAAVPGVRAPGLNGVDIFGAVQQNDVAKLRTLLVPGADLNFPVRDQTPLIYAIKFSKPEIVKMLLAAGADPHQADLMYGESPLGAAVLVGNFEIVEMLVNVYKADVNHRSKPGRTPLYTAADFNRDERITKFLLDKGANPATITLEGRTPLDAAINGKKAAIATLLTAATDAQEIKRLKDEFAAAPPPKWIAPVSSQTPLPTPAPTPRPVYGEGLDDPATIAYLRNEVISQGKRAGFTLLDEGTIAQQSIHARNWSLGKKTAVFQGTIYQFVIVSKNALTINGDMLDLLQIPCSNCRTSISEYSTSLARGKDSTGQYSIVSLQMRLHNFQQNYATFIANGPNPGSKIKWILLTKPDNQR